jgi:hypothetical protein
LILHNFSNDLSTYPESLHLVAVRAWFYFPCGILQNPHEPQDKSLEYIVRMEAQ